MIAPERSGAPSAIEGPRGALSLRLAWLLGLVPLLAWLALLESTTRPRADFAFCNQTEVSSLDPAVGSGSAEGRLIGALFEGLTRMDPASTDPLPGLATHWEVSGDGLTWTFLLREDARWSDGRPVTAEDLRWSWTRLLHPSTGARYAYLLWCLEGAEAYTAGPVEAAVTNTALGVEVPEEGWERHFAMGTQLQDPGAYPSPATLVGHLRAAGVALVGRCATLDETEAGQAWGSSFPDGSESVDGGAHFLFMHETYHLGQVGLLRRIRGKPGFA